MFYETDEIPALRHLEENWLSVLDELRSLKASNFVSWPETDIYTGTWAVFGLYEFGTKNHRHATLCPNTTALVEAIPGMVTAGFSGLAPGAHIKPHHGTTPNILRVHLGLLNPPDCAIRVGTETRSWTPGRCLVFDDTVEHEAWNRSTKARIVLLLDVARDPAAGAKYPDYFKAFAKAAAR